MRINVILILLLLLGISGFSQTPGVTWSKRFGGNGNDEIHRIIPTADTGWLVFGTSASTNGDIGVNKGGTDVWITYWNRFGKVVWKKNVGGGGADGFADVSYNADGTFYVLNNASSKYHFFKMDLKGNLLFQATYGGAGTDNPIKIIPHSDGFLLVGNTTSYDLPSHHGGTDVYVVRLQFVKDTTYADTVGVVHTTLKKVWDRCLGGTLGDKFFDGTTDAAGNFFLISESQSNNGDVSGLHGGGGDIWVVSLSADSIINWQKCYGGYSNEFFGAFVKTSDNNFVIGAKAASYDGDVTGFHYGGIGVPDAWVFKIDMSGNILWKNCFGGTGSDEIYGIVQQNNEIYVTSTTTSNNGDVSGHHGPYRGTDIWVFKLGLNGELRWNRCLGGTKEESFAVSGQSALIFRNPIFADKDGGILIQCYSPSVDGDVTGFHGTATSNVQDIWLVKLSANGALEWQRCFGGTGREQAGHLVQNGSNNYTFGFSSLSADGDMGGSYGGQDALLARLGPVNQVLGNVFIDTNKNGVFDLTEKLFPYDIKMQAVKGSDTTISAANRGKFILERDSGTHEIKVLPEFSYLVPTPASHTISFKGYFNKDSVDFGLQPVAGHKDLICKIVPLGPARTGMLVSFLILVGNAGSESLNNVQLKFVIDRNLVFHNASPAQSGKLNDTIYWNISELNAFEEFKIYTVNCSVKIPPAVTLGDIASLMADIGFHDQDFSPENNSDTVKVVITGSFDPNDKSESHAGKLNVSAVQHGEYLDYYIRFQNTGTDTAFTVVITDTLVERFDYNTFQMIYASHPYSLAIKNKKFASWTFSNINLPDSNRNEVASHGIIAYRVKLKNNVSFGEVIPNSASIYFDFNSPVKTNIHNTLIEVQQPTILSFSPAVAAKGASVSITGTNFTGTTAVGFGGTAATSFTVTSPTSITAVVGGGASGDVSVTTPGGTTTRSGFTFIAAPTITSFTPISVAAGATVTITGTNLTGATAVSFGGIATTSFTVNSPTSITAVVGGGASGDVSVTTPGGTATRTGFTFIADPTITSFTPTNAATGTSITITGTNLTGATAVSFGGTDATSFTVNSATSITAVVANGASGNVSVTTLGGTATLAGFTFISVPTIASFTPTSGADGASVTIIGTNLTGATAVSFGGTAATSFTVNSTSSITATVGTGASGDVTVTTPGGTATLLGFTFIASPIITSFTPTSGAAGTSVVITGANLSSATAVSFGGTAAASFNVNSATTITAVVGTGASGNLSITTPGGTVTMGGFTFISAPAITSFTPNSGDAGTVVTISGTNLNGATAVSFGGTAATSYTVNSATSITAIVGTGTTGDVSVTTPGGTATLGGFIWVTDPVPAVGSAIRIYPNPTPGKFTIDTLHISDNWESLEILDATGRGGYKLVNLRNQAKVSVDISQFQSGLYMVLLKRRSGKPLLLRFLKL